MPPQGWPARALATALLALVASCASATRPMSVPAPGGAPELEAMCASQQDAWNRGDLERFMALGYWNSEALTFFSGGDWTRGYTPMFERYVKRYASGGNEMGVLTFSELESAPLGADHGVVRGRWQLAFADGKKLGGLFTLLFARMSEGWRIVHDHTSVSS